MTPQTHTRPHFHTAHRFNCGHERTPENTYRLKRFYRKKDGTRSDYVNDYCKVCQRARAAKIRERAA